MMIRIEVCNLQYFSDGLKPPTSGRFVALIYLMMEWMDADVVPVFQEDAWMMVPIVGWESCFPVIFSQRIHGLMDDD